MSVYLIRGPFHRIAFDGGYVTVNQTWTGKTWNVIGYYSAEHGGDRRIALRKRRSEAAALECARKMAALWSHSNPDFA